MNELSINNAMFDVQQGGIQFYNYDEILEQAHEIADLIKSVEVDESSIQGTKKLLASVNKRVNELETERIRIKKELLEPYMEFEKQIKTISSVVKESDNELRSKVRELEELERQEKKRILGTVFDKRIKLYPNLYFLELERFLKPSHLNKTISLNKVELELVQWLEQRKKEVDLINTTTGADLEKYIETLDLIDALPKKEVEPVKTVVTPKKEFTTIQVDSDRLAEVVMYLKFNSIEHKLK